MQNQNEVGCPVEVGETFVLPLEGLDLPVGSRCSGREEGKKVPGHRAESHWQEYPGLDSTRGRAFSRLLACTNEARSRALSARPPGTIVSDDSYRAACAACACCSPGASSRPR